MASFPFRHPQFSDDVAWLPAWLQSDNAATSLNQLNEDSLHHFIQTLHGLKGDNNKVKDPNLQLSIESRYSIGQLYLSGEGNTPVTLSPSCEKVLHFNLHLSTDGILSNHSPSCKAFSCDDKLHFPNGTPVQTGEALHASKGSIQSNMEHNSSAINLFSSSLDKEGSGNVYVEYYRTRCSSTHAMKDVPDIFNPKGTECDGINDAVELSVAASEALAIHELVHSGSVSEALSATDILEVALRVKQARLDGLKDSLCCSENDVYVTDVLSELSDFEMEDAYKDVGLSVNNIVSILFKESSISRVKDTPLPEFHLTEEREVESEQQRDQEVCLSSSFATEFIEKSSDINTSKVLLTEILDCPKQEVLDRIPMLDFCGSQNENLDDLHLTQGDNSYTVNVDGNPHQVEVNSFSPSGKASGEFTAMQQHSHFLDMNKVNDNSTCSFQSRWFGGWIGKEEGVAGGKKSEGTKIIPKPFIAETSYLSESADVAPDQNSFVHNHHHGSKASESSIPLEGLWGSVGTGGLSGQDMVKDSYIDPLCSVVPCSISAEIDDSPHTTRVLDTVNSQKTDSEIPGIPLGNIKICSGDNDENINRKELGELLVDAIDPNYKICRQLTSLRPYSVGLAENSQSSLKRTFDCGLASQAESRARLPYGKQEISNNKCHNDNNLMKLPLVRSISNCATARSAGDNHEMTLLVMEQHISCTAINDEEKLAASGFGNASCKPTHDDFEQNAKNGAQLQEKQVSPLVLSRRTRHRFKAPKFSVADCSTANQVEPEDLGPDMICHKHTDIPRGLGNKFLESETPARKRVRFSEIVNTFHPKKNLTEIQASCKIRSSHRAGTRPELIDQELGITSQEVKECLTNFRVKGRKKAVFQGLEFLLTGFSKNKEKETEALLRKHGGMVLPDIPSPPLRSRGRRSLKFEAQRLPVVLCTKKLQTTEFLYGCAVNAFLLKVAWAYDSIEAGSVLLPDKYVILSNQMGTRMNQIEQSVCQSTDNYIFHKVGIMMHGKNSFCSKLVEVIKHGRGRVYRSLHWLVQGLESKKISFGVVVTVDENRATRHLKKCATEQKIPVVAASWVIRSLFEGKLLPFDENHHFSHAPAMTPPSGSVQQEWSQEI